MNQYLQLLLISWSFLYFMKNYNTIYNNSSFQIANQVSQQRKFHQMLQTILRQFQKKIQMSIHHLYNQSQRQKKARMIIYITKQLIMQSQKKFYILMTFLYYNNQVCITYPLKIINIYIYKHYPYPSVRSNIFRVSIKYIKTFVKQVGIFLFLSVCIANIYYIERYYLNAQQIATILNQIVNKFQEKSKKRMKSIQFTQLNYSYDIYLFIYQTYLLQASKIQLSQIICTSFLFSFILKLKNLFLLDHFHFTINLLEAIFIFFAKQTQRNVTVNM
ncbi:transmembrane protein, putative (macronuclear) [Tetrahymena thermophila SB210]|uniref:Transmembrane protein, putative n=1 Tax=Tetrahymena thermophila (strain SB210) TaxID=312017 RepID=W7XFF1_TETTS|nr:transmembrane protein, putative [Tetrahymena thermophila SB210]EWS72736.1 transmembrane protein, putative [Tetrahymena thermophila SB210]|eukprot:XP_012654714.1 transmembrane protein, putative [Tetrahymena thermophila SB210]